MSRPIQSSNLSGLFSTPLSGDGESNDALRYRAPREPKPANPSPAPAPSAQSSSTTPAAQPASSIIASARVRLFKLNPSTNAYDTYANGETLGCVILGGGVTFQILIYDAAKKPQCTTPITLSFRVNLNGNYMSFNDATGSSWSALFDGEEPLRQFALHIMCVISHVAEHSQAQGQPITQMLTATDAADATRLASSDTAGVSIRGWEVVSSAGTSPAEMLRSPFIDTSRTDLLKLKLSRGSEEPIGGVVEHVVGLTKGDIVLVALPPRVSMSGVGDRSNRRNIGVWILVEITVHKTKSNKDKPQSVSAPQVPEAEDEPQERKSEDLGARMRSLSAKQGQGVAMLGDALGGTLKARRTSTDEPNSEPGVHPQRTFTQEYSQHAKDAFPQQQFQPEQHIQQQHSAPQQQQPYMQTKTYTSSAQTHTERDPYNPTATLNPQQYFAPQHSYINPYNNTHSNPNPSYDYAVTLVPGQEARSAHLGPQQPAPQHMHQDPSSRYQGSQPQYDPWNTSVGSHGPAPVNGNLSVVQSTLFEVNSKLDRLLMAGGISHFTNGGSAGPLKTKVGELSGILQQIVEEYERMRFSTGRDDERVDRLQSRVDVLQSKNEQLMNEKAALLEKHTEYVMRGADNSSRHMELIQEVTSLRSERDRAVNRTADLQRQLTDAVAQAQNVHDVRRDQSLEQESHTKKLEQMLQQITTLQSEIQTCKSQLSSERAAWTQEKNDYIDKSLAVQRDLRAHEDSVMDANREMRRLKAALEEATSRVHQLEHDHLQPASVDLNAPQVQALIEENTSQLQQQLQTAEAQKIALQLQLTQAEEELQSSKSELESVQDALAVAQTATPSPPSSGLAVDQVKTLMNSVFVAVSEAVEGLDAQAGGAGIPASSVISAFKIVLRDVTKQTLAQISSS